MAVSFLAPQIGALSLRNGDVLIEYLSFLKVFPLESPLIRCVKWFVTNGRSRSIAANIRSTFEAALDQPEQLLGDSNSIKLIQSQSQLSTDLCVEDSFCFCFVVLLQLVYVSVMNCSSQSTKSF